MHLGHVLSAYFVWGTARIAGAKVILRFEDHDTTRARQKYCDAITQDLEWLGLQPDQVMYQSEHFERFQRILDDLAQRELTYACACGRAAIAARHSVTSERYDNFCRGRRVPHEGNGIRLKVEGGRLSFHDISHGACEQEPALQCGDFLLKDRHGCFTYALANVVDDIDEGVNLIIRGDDILGTTGRQLYLRSLLAPSLPIPTYLHHPLLMSQERKGQKLSKSKFDLPIAEYRKQGYKPGDLLGTAMHQIGWIEDSGKKIDFEEWIRHLTRRYHR